MNRSSFDSLYKALRQYTTINRASWIGSMLSMMAGKKQRACVIKFNSRIPTTTINKIAADFITNNLYVSVSYSTDGHYLVIFKDQESMEVWKKYGLKVNDIPMCTRCRSFPKGHAHPFIAGIMSGKTVQDIRARCVINGMQQDEISKSLERDTMIMESELNLEVKELG